MRIPKIPKKITDLRKLPIVRVEWEDAASGGKWLPYLEAQSQRGLVCCETIGFLVKRSAKELLVCQSVSENGHVDGGLTIPTRSVRSIKVLCPRGR